ncbi:DUF2628 domain-containing protein [soil metagenome]
MPLYTVMAPPPRDSATAPDPLRFVFVKDGFTWPALILPQLWLLFRKMWIVFLLYVAVGLGLMYLAATYGGPLPWVALAFVQLLFALEASQLRRLSLARRGYEFLGVVEGRRSEVETRFFADWQPPVAMAPPAEASPAADAPPSPFVPQVSARPSAEAGEVVGLFPAPEAKP